MARAPFSLHPGSAVIRSEPPAHAIEPSSEIGRQLRHLRLAKRLTLQKLADQSGVSIGYLSQLERGRSVVTVAILMRISETLGVPLNFFFSIAAAGRSDERDVVVRADQRRQLTFPGLGICDELLSPDLAGPIEMLLSTIAPSADSGEPYRHEGAEAGFVMSGALELWVGERRFELRAGDSFSFRSDVPHRYRNPGREPAKIVWIVTPPSY
jgi:transcriptional regulator with XRE-family HTH domain